MTHKHRFFQARYLRFVSQTLFWTPLLVAVVAAYILASAPQMHEVYLGIVEDVDLLRGGLGLAALGLFCAFLYVWHQSMALQRIDEIYPEHADIYFDREILNIRDFKAALVAGLPIFGLLMGLVILFGRVFFAAQDASDIASELSLTNPEATELTDRLSRLPEATLFAAGLLAIAGLGVVTTLYATRSNMTVKTSVLSISYAIAATVLLIPLVQTDYILAFSRVIGPLAGCGLVLVTCAVIARAAVFIVQLIFGALASFVARVLMLLTAFPSWGRYIIYAGAVLALPLVVMYGHVWGPPAVQRAIAVPKTAGNENSSDEPEIVKQFGEWLASRQDRSSGEYPVFIIAAQGGGIYAASAVASFLALVQERCPQFAQHIFAISAVSGGAIGASIFNAMMQGEAQVEQAKCSFGTASRLSSKVRPIVLEDHLTPVILELLPDAVSQPLIASLAEAIGGREMARNRAGMLERSFAQSFNSAEVANASNVRSFGLDLPYSEHWNPQKAAPALVLNATWVETGYRVAFSPFALGPVSDGTLYSFAELDNSTGVSQDISLIQSSGISARFPVILPSWTIERDVKDQWLSDRWTFVDGAYADGSGSMTALEIFNAIKARAKRDGAEPYMILLTNTAAEPQFSKISSSWIDAYLAPAATVLRVRELLGWRAVTQARTQLGDRVIVLQLEHRAFPLPLGWKISRTSNALIEFMTGTPETCREEKAHGESLSGPVQLAINAITSNSCQLRRLISLISGGA